MRTIKFRGYSSRHKEWGYGTIIINKDNSIDIYGEDYIMEVDKNTIGQYAYSKDMRGMDIYEGDLLKFTDGIIYEVFFCETTKAFMIEPLYDKEGNDISGCMDYLEGWNTEKECVVVGNIYDNHDGRSL